MNTENNNNSKEVTWYVVEGAVYFDHDKAVEALKDERDD